MVTGRLGIFHGMKSYFCQDEFGQIAPVYSISAGLDYPGIGPEHAWLHDTGRAEYVPVTDDEAVDAFEYLSRTEGIIPAIESAHAVAYAKLAPTMRPNQSIVITLSGRGDKDVAAIARYRGEDLHENCRCLSEWKGLHSLPGPAATRIWKPPKRWSRPWPKQEPTFIELGTPLLRSHRRGPGHSGGQPARAQSRNYHRQGI